MVDIIEDQRLLELAEERERSNDEEVCDIAAKRIKEEMPP
jgi:hypothetical protein